MAAVNTDLSPVAVRNIPRWMLWVPVDPMRLDRWGALWPVPALGLACWYLVLSPVKTCVGLLACWWAISGAWWLGLLPVAAAWGLGKLLGSPGWAAGGPLGRSYRACQARGKLRRGWARLLREAEVTDGRHRVPKHGRIRRTGTGLRVKVRHGAAGVAYTTLADGCEVLAGLVGGLHSVRARRVNPDWCWMYFNVVNPLRDTIPMKAMPVAAFPRVTLGRTAEGPWYTPTVLGRHFVFIGETGAGKSSLVWDFIAGCEQWDIPPTWWVIDPKLGIELGPMDRELGGIAHRYTRDARTADSFIAGLAEEAERRGEIMRRMHWKTWRAELGPLHFLVIDEFLALGDRVTRKSSNLYKLLTMSRAVGIQVVACTQLPQVDSTAVGRIIQLFNFRVIGSCSNAGMTASALGEAGVSAAPAHELSVPQDAGIFFAKEEGRTGFAKFKAGFVDDSDDRMEHLPVARGALRKQSKTAVLADELTQEVAA